jgi:hypothetical protein
LSSGFEISESGIDLNEAVSTMERNLIQKALEKPEECGEGCAAPRPQPDDAARKDEKNGNRDAKEIVSRQPTFSMATL